MRLQGLQAQKLDLFRYAITAGMINIENDIIDL